MKGKALMNNLLVTGGAGFIGSNFILHTIEKYPNYKVINLDKLTYAANLDNLRRLKDSDNYFFVEGDICDYDLVQSIFKEHSINMVINFAAESHVDRSIDGPYIFLRSNVAGTQTLLQVALNNWLETDLKGQKFFSPKVKFLQISTDEVYGTLGPTGKFKETTNLNPNSPYSASKASADFFVRAYGETYGLPYNITRCSNNYGPHQHKEKMIPVIIQSILNNTKIPVYGDGLQIRDWLHVKDHCEAIDVVLHEGKEKEVYNIGGNTELTNLELIKLILKKMSKSEDLIEFVKDRPGHDRRYAIEF
jgi:dTDP-glucose 4,6-dehydratase